MNYFSALLLSAAVTLCNCGIAIAGDAATNDTTNNKTGTNTLTLAAATMETVVVEGNKQHGAVALDDTAHTGSRLDIPTRDLPVSISVVTQDLIREHGARTAVEALYGAVGMTGGTSVGSIPNYATRGFTGNDITVMRDGIRQNTTSQSSRPLDSFLFERVEVLKGPASLLYGEGAIGGAVNYVSKQPDKEFRGEVNASAGSWDTYRLGVGVGGPAADNVFYRFDASKNKSGGYVDDSDAEFGAYAGAVRWEISEKTSVTFRGTYLNDDVKSYYGTPVVYDAIIDQGGQQFVRKANANTDTLVNSRIASGTRRLNYDNRDNFAEAEDAFASVIIDHEISSEWTLRNELYSATQHLNWRNTESTVWNPATQLVDRSSFFLIYRNDLQIGDRLDLTWSGDFWGHANKFLLGALYDGNDQVRNSGQTYAASPTPASVPLTGFDRGYGPDVRYRKTFDIDTDTKAAYIENVFDANDALKLIAGLRYDEITVTRSAYSYPDAPGAPTYNKWYYPLTGRLGSVYAITPEWNIYASYTKAAQPVSQLVSLTSSQDDFSLQKGVQYEIGSKATLWDGHADLTVAVFDIEKNDLLTSQVVDDVRINSQVGAQVSQGAEIALAVNLADDWHIEANFARTWQAEFKDYAENIGASSVISRDGNTPPNVAKTVAGLFVSKDIGAWSGSVGARYVGERQANNNNSIQLDSYTTLDASIGYQWDKHLTTTLWGRNLGNETYAEWASGNGLMQRLADPRSFEANIRYTF